MAPISTLAIASESGARKVAKNASFHVFGKVMSMFLFLVWVWPELVSGGYWVPLLGARQPKAPAARVVTKFRYMRQHTYII